MQGTNATAAGIGPHLARNGEGLGVLCLEGAAERNGRDGTDADREGDLSGTCGR
jgi:hypothetical protein